MKKTSTALLCALLLSAVGVFAVQNPSGSRSSGQMGSQPSQTYPPPQGTQPSQGTPPSQQPGQPGQPQAAPRGQMPTLDDQVKILADQLNLTGDQQTKVKGILVDQREQAMTLVRDPAMSNEDKLQKIQTLRETTIARVRGVLNDDQKPKFDQMVNQQNERMRQRQDQGGTPPNAPPPSTRPPATTAPPK
jgi:periplasmic protein CpxP/Spy